MKGYFLPIGIFILCIIVFGIIVGGVMYLSQDDSVPATIDAQIPTYYIETTDVIKFYGDTNVALFSLNGVSCVTVVNYRGTALSCDWENYNEG